MDDAKKRTTTIESDPERNSKECLRLWDTLAANILYSINSTDHNRKINNVVQASSTDIGSKRNEPVAQGVVKLLRQRMIRLAIDPKLSQSPGDVRDTTCLLSVHVNAFSNRTHSNTT